MGSTNLQRDLRTRTQYTGNSASRKGLPEFKTITADGQNSVPWFGTPLGFGQRPTTRFLVLLERLRTLNPKT